MTKATENTIVGISIGDINGIGAEVVVKALSDNRILELCTPVIFANGKTLSGTRKAIDNNFNFQRIDSLDDLIHGKINVLNVWKDHENVMHGIDETKAGKYAFESLKAATQALKTDKIDVLVTAPINKKNIQSAEFKFPGHTDYLAQELEGQSLMFMIHDELKVGLLTDHVPVKDVASLITEELIRQKVNIIIQSLVQDFTITKPKIAILGLNPHCGDNGVIGDEDDKILRPTIDKLFNEGKMVFGPYPSDSFFGTQQYKKFDAVIAPYHDQGLTPFKTLSFGEGVNYTAGLKKVRTSPDHGTGYEIANKGIADETSFRQAIYKGIDIFNARKIHEEISENPLKKSTQTNNTKKR
ncbi:MAG: 4-hydroxythreonine-4-phosphate dehydrogenase PdxA [Flavobacteriales bacterium]|nr:4-hydroxythreonine-4-phosphate dehydrogenase PdxA [Flavobacteriales bacterium]